MRHVLFSILALLMISLASCQFHQPESPKNSENPSKSNSSGVVAVLSVNDIHAAIDQMPKFAALADSLRQVYPDLLLFSAGDNRTGNPVNDQYDPVGYPIIALMNKVGFDVSALGNHDWDGGREALQKNIEDADFPFLCANVSTKNGAKLDVKPCEIFDVQGLSVGVIGMLELRANGYPSAHPRHFKDVSFEPAEKKMQDYMFLRDQCNILILLSHLGFEEDLEIAERYPSLDAIIGGHSHTLVEYPQKHHGVMVTQAGSKLKNATLTLFQVKNGKVVDVSATTLDIQKSKKKDAAVKALLDEFNSDKQMKTVLATAASPFQNREEIGCMVTDAIRDLSEADFAFTNTGGIRLNRLNKGPITVKDVYEIDPFDNDVVVFTMTGKQVEHFIKESYKKNGRHPSYVSGMQYEVRTASDGYPRSVNISLDNGRFSKDATYTVAMNDYMASTVRLESLDDGESMFMTTTEMLIEYLKKQKRVSYQGVTRAR